MNRRTRKLCLWLGVMMMVGSVAHTLGVGHLYATKGWPDLNRILLDIWIAEAQLGGGFLFVRAYRSEDPRPWTVGGAMIVWSYAVPFLPVLVHRAPVVFWVPPSLYSILCAWDRGRDVAIDVHRVDARVLAGSLRRRRSARSLTLAMHARPRFEPALDRRSVSFSRGRPRDLLPRTRKSPITLIVDGRRHRQELPRKVEARNFRVAHGSSPVNDTGIIVPLRSAPRASPPCRLAGR